MYPDYEEMRAFQVREETGHLPDEQLILTEEDDLSDPDQREVLTLVAEQYAITNCSRREARLCRENDRLRALLAEHRIEIPDIDG